MPMAEQDTTWKPNPEDIPQLKAEADAGNAVSQYNLGLCYANGNGVEVDLAEAVKWFRKAAEQGLPEAQHNLGICLSRGAGVEKNVAEGAMWLNSAAQQGDDEAERMLKRWWGD